MLAASLIVRALWKVDLRALLEVITVYKSSCLIMDEVDLLLHPLKSELNFPIGKKHALDVSPQRWQCAIHCCDAVFYAERRSMAVHFEQSARAKSILEELVAVIERGYEVREPPESFHDLPRVLPKTSHELFRDLP